MIVVQALKKKLRYLYYVYIYIDCDKLKGKKPSLPRWLRPQPQGKRAHWMVVAYENDATLMLWPSVSRSEPSRTPIIKTPTDLNIFWAIKVFITSLQFQRLFWWLMVIKQLTKPCRVGFSIHSSYICRYWYRYCWSVNVLATHSLRKEKFLT